MQVIDWLSQPWPWYVSGPLIGLTVPALLLSGNKTFGVSSSLRHICAACLPANISFFQYNWKRESWNLFFVVGILLGSFLSVRFLGNQGVVEVAPALINEMKQYGITDSSQFVPSQLLNWPNLLTLKGFILMVGGGFLVGFGTRYAGGCTSGHSIMGLSNLQWPSLVATICFMAGGFIMVNLILPFILRL